VDAPNLDKTPGVGFGPAGQIVSHVPLSGSATDEGRL
jgi:hypothetical protein